MHISLSKLDKSDLNLAFDLYKTYMEQIIESAMGWDEHFQQSHFLSRLQPQWFYWILRNNEREGLICYRHKSTSLHIHLLIVFESSQRKGVASLTIQELLNQAHSIKEALTLSCFKKTYRQ